MHSGKAVLFEPWNLGDAIVALATAIQDPDRLCVACHSRWHNILRSAAHGLRMPELLTVDLGYVSRNKSDDFNIGTLPEWIDTATILSIRGDIRDYLAAKKIFPRSRILMTGWFSFFAKRVPILDIPFAHGWLSIRNRYQAWASLANVSWSSVENFYREKLPAPGVPTMAVHVGAQWRSRQFPYFAELVAALRQSFPVKVIAGANDPLPDGMDETDVSRLVNQDLVEALKSSTYVIANDSGPMHLAAFVRSRTIVISRKAAIREWLPPTVVAVESVFAPRGYRSDRLSDSVSSGWPPVSEIVNLFEALPEHSLA
jgi:Glycosyltransferase family 9 (heptosyltransferase)